MDIKSKTESELGFSLRQDYSSLIFFRAQEENKRLKSRPGFAAVIIGFITIVLCADGSLIHSQRLEFFYLGISIAIFAYLYLLYKNKSEIASNKLAIERWRKELELQSFYSACLYELEEEFNKTSTISIANKVVQSINGQKSSGVLKK